MLFNYLMPDSKLFLYIYSASILPGMVPWFALAVSQFRFRANWKSEMGAHPFKSLFFPFSNYITVIFLSLVLVGMWFNPDTRTSLIVGAVFILMVIAGYYVFGIGRRQQR
ncbi:putative transport protein YifK [compost metagenome]